VDKLFSVITEAPIGESDKRLVEQLYVKYHRLMLYIANSIFCDYALAEDAVSESLIKIMRYRKKLHDVSSHQTKAYIVSIVRTTSLNLLKKKDSSFNPQTEELSDEITDEHADMLDELISREGYDSLMSAFQSLPPPLKEIAYKRFVLNLSHSNRSTAQPRP
jgi:RNA polymerase sigma-70 factor (ECF subfamily)